MIQIIVCRYALRELLNATDNIWRYTEALLIFGSDDRSDNIIV